MPGARARRLPLTLLDRGRPVHLDYDGMLAYHGGSALAGATLGYRVMQAASAALCPSGERLAREALHVLSGHPGPGYRDAFEYVTRCVSRRCYVVRRNLAAGRLSPWHDYAFQFRITDRGRARTAIVILRDGILPADFFVVLRDLARAPDAVTARRLASLKARIARRALRLTLKQLFTVETVAAAIPAAAGRSAPRPRR